MDSSLRVHIEFEPEMKYWARVICTNPGNNPKEKAPPTMEYISDADQQFPFVIGSESTASLNGMTHRELLLNLGYEEDWLNRKVGNGLKFSLAVFQEDRCSVAPVNASWEGIFSMIEVTSPECASKLLPIWEDIKLVECIADGHIDKPSPETKIHVSSFDGFANYTGQCTAELGRMFLRHTMKCTALYKGDGYAWNDKGERGVKEYIMPRVLTASLNPTTIDLVWELPVAPAIVASGIL